MALLCMDETTTCDPPSCSSNGAPPLKKKEKHNDCDKNNKNSLITIKIDQDWYDITNFVHVHPGGPALIQDFSGRDATEVFYAFHVRHDQALRRVRKLQGAPPTPTTLLEKTNGQHGLPDNDADKAFSRDMQAMIHQMRLQGYFVPSKTMLIQKMLLAAIFFVTGWTKVFDATSCGGAVVDSSSRINWQALVVAAIFIALFLQQCGFLLHDFMHNNWFHNRKIDQAFGRFFGTFCVGLSGLHWRDEHFVHHVFTNTLEHGKAVKDIQMAEDVWAQNADLLQFFDGSLRTRQMDILPFWITEKIIRYQAYLWLPLTVIFGRMNIIVASFVKEHRNEERFLQLCHVAWFVALLWAAFPTWQSALMFHFMVSIGQGVLHVQLLVSHYVKPWHDLNDMKVAGSWYKNQVVSTVNIAPFLSTRCWRSFESKTLDQWDDYYAPWFDDWFHGGLNLHIEHHVNPTLPRNSLRECSIRIRQVCQKHGIRYDERHFFQAVWDTLVQLDTVGRKARFSLHSSSS